MSTVYKDIRFSSTMWSVSASSVSEDDDGDDNDVEDDDVEDEDEVSLKLPCQQLYWQFKTCISILVNMINTKNISYVSAPDMSLT